MMRIYLRGAKSKKELKAAENRNNFHNLRYFQKCLLLLMMM